MKAIIIDDENKARSVLKTIINEECPEVKIVAEAEDLFSGVAKIREYKPDVVFLDIEMPNHSGLEIADFFKNSPSNIGG